MGVSCLSSFVSCSSSCSIAASTAPINAATPVPFPPAAHSQTEPGCRHIGLWGLWGLTCSTSCYPFPNPLPIPFHPLRRRWFETLICKLGRFARTCEWWWYHHGLSCSPDKRFDVLSAVYGAVVLLVQKHAAVSNHSSSAESRTCFTLDTKSVMLNRFLLHSFSLWEAVAFTQGTSNCN